MNSQSRTLRMFNDQWRVLQSGLHSLKSDVRRAARQERAEVAASVPVYATIGDLPAVGQLGRLAAVSADSKLYFDNGTTWKEVTLT